MIPFDLTRWFRVRMLPLVVLVALVVQIAAPLSYYLTKRHELWQQARAEAAQAAVVLHAEIEQHPSLWRYNTPRLHERLASEGLLDGRVLRIRDSEGQAVELDSPPVPRRPLWGRTPVMVVGAQAASIWVALDQAPLLDATFMLAMAFAGLAGLLGAVLYLVPMRTIAVAQRHIRALHGELTLTLQEEDRHRIARDLHDGAGQALTAARLRLLALEQHGGEAADRREIARLLDDALDEVRRSVHTLAPPALDELGLGGALKRHCATFATATGLTVLCDIAELPPLRPKTEVACYRIVQEALANSARHARARRAWVELALTDAGLRIVIYDDGIITAAPPLVEGQGLLGIRERARLLGGRAEITIAANQGLRIDALLPV